MAKGGSLQKVGGGLAAASLLIPYFGFLMSGTFHTHILGVSFETLTAIGGALALVGTILTPFKPDSPGEDFAQSPAHHLTTPQNPPKGDAVMPIIFGTRRVLPVHVMSFTTPKGMDPDDDFSKVLKQPGQQFSWVGIVAVDRIHSIDDVWIDGSPLWSWFQDTAGGPKHFANGDGSTKTFTLPGQRIVRESIQVYENSTLRGYTTATRTDSILIRDNLKLYTITIDENFAEEYPITFKRNGVSLTTSSVYYPMVWKDGDRTLKVWTQTQWTAGDRLQVSYTYRGSSTITIGKQTKDGVKVTFATAPSQTTRLFAKYKMVSIPGVSAHIRLGGPAQLPTPSSGRVQQTFGANREEIVKANYSTTFTTRDAVDDVVINITSGPAGLTQYDKESGARDPVEAQFIIEYRKNGDTAWIKLPDPVGVIQGGGKVQRKNANEFRIRGDTASEWVWSFSIRGILEKLQDRRPTRNHATLLENFTRSRYQWRVKRTNAILNSTNSLAFDRIYLLSYTTVLDEKVNMTGVAYLELHGIPRSRIRSSLPVVEVKATGLRGNYKHDGSAWVQDDDVHTNPVWSAIRCLTDARWGGGNQFTLAANVDATSAKTAADWCDASVTLANQPGVTEKRARLDAVIDVRTGLMSIIRDILMPARVIPVWHGDVLKFVIDQSVSLASVQTYTADGVTARIREGSFNATRAPKAAQPTELEIVYYDEAKDYENREFLVVPSKAVTDVRKHRIELFGVVRRSQAARVGQFLYDQVTNAGPDVRLQISVKALRHEAGDVFGITHTEAGVTTTRYFRCVRITWPDTRSIWVDVEAREYVANAYGGESIWANTIPGGTSRRLQTDRGRRTSHGAVTIRRVA